MPGATISEEFIVRSKEPVAQVPNLTVTRCAFDKFDEHPDHEFFVQYETGARLTGADITDKARRLATVLVEKYGADENDVAAIYSGNLLEFIIAQFGALAAGMPFSPITINCKAIEILRQIDDCKARFIFTSKINAQIIEEVYQKRKELIKAVIVLDGEHEGFISLDSLLREAKHIHPKLPYNDLDPKKAVYSIIYTSGSTGLPKGAAQSHYGMMFNVINTVGQPELGYMPKNSIVCGSLPAAHGSGILTVLTSTFSRAKMVLIEVPFQDKILDCVHKYKCNWLFINALLGLYLISNPDANKYDLSSLRYVYAGGVAFPGTVASALIQKYGFRFREIYGATEMNLISLQRAHEKWESCNLGSPIPGTLLKVVDINTGKTCKPGESGEVLLYGPSRIIGYINRPDANKAAFTDDGWYRTGDIGYVRPEGNLFLIDRIKQMIKYLGYAVYPVECESILYMHNDVQACVVVPFPHPAYGELPRAYVVLKEGATVTEQELEQFVAQRIADQKRLRGGIRFVDEISMISIGKPNRPLFKELAAKESAMVYKPSQSKPEVLLGKRTAVAAEVAVNGKENYGNLSL